MLLQQSILLPYAVQFFTIFMTLRAHSDIMFRQPHISRLSEGCRKHTTLYILVRLLINETHICPIQDVNPSRTTPISSVEHLKQASLTKTSTVHYTQCMCVPCSSKQHKKSRYEIGPLLLCCLQKSAYRARGCFAYTHKKSFELES